MTDLREALPLRVDRRAFVLVALLALAAAGPSLLNGFAYDDQWIVQVNPRIHDLHRWQEWLRTSYWPTAEGSLYRPLTTAGYALQWAAAHGAAWLFHLVNVLCYAAGAVAFLWLASLLLPASAALVAGALFAVDPVHVEAVANIVGQAELTAGFTMLVATALYIRARRARHAGTLDRSTTLAIAALYIAGMLLKEHAIVLPAWLLAAELTLFNGERPLRARLRELAPVFALLGGAALLVLALRWNVLGTLGGDIPHPSVADIGPGQRALVMLGVLPEFARLLVWPARLYADYSPAHVFVSASPDVSQLNGLCIAAAVIALIVVTWRRSPVAAFGLVIGALVWLPTSNLVFPSGVLLAERALYLPSAGVLLAAGSGIAWLDAREGHRAPVRSGALALLGAALVAGCMRSIERDRVWRSSEEVFWTMLHDEPLSFKAHHAWGGVLFERGDRLGGEREWRMAIRIMPQYHKVYQDLAGKYLEAGLCQAALPLYDRAIALGGPLPLSRAGVTACQLQLAQFTAARHTARLGMIDGNDPAWFRARLFSAESALVANDSLRRK